MFFHVSRFSGYPANAISAHDASLDSGVISSNRFSKLIAVRSGVRRRDGSRKRREEARDSNYFIRHVQLTMERAKKIERPETNATSAPITLPRSTSSNIKMHNPINTHKMLKKDATK